MPEMPPNDGRALPYSASDFTGAMLALLPSGPVWPRETDAVLPRVIAGLAPTYERMSARAGALLLDAPVGTLDELLPEWEATLGLPDPCAGPAPNLAQRRASVAAAISAQGGQSATYVLSLLRALGRSGTVTSFAPARSGLLGAGEPLYGPAWAHAWQVTVNLATFPDDAASDAVVECVLRRMMPAHTVLIVVFPSGSGIGVLDPPIGSPGPGLLNRIALI